MKVRARGEGRSTWDRLEAKMREAQMDAVKSGDNAFRRANK